MSLHADRTWRLGGQTTIPTICKGPGQPALVSVVIPTFNRAYILGSVIDSVLAQAYRPIEVIVVDDGSTDATSELVRSYEPLVRYVKQENQGLAAARNAGLAVAQGEFIAFEDSDDLWMPWKLEVQVALMRRFPQVGLVWTDLTAVDPQGNVVAPLELKTMYGVYRRINILDWLQTHGRIGELSVNCPPELATASYRVGDIFTPMLMGNLVHPPVALMRRSHVHRAGGLDLSFSWTCEDYEFFWRVSREGPAALIEASSMLYRVTAADQLTKPGLLVYVARGNLAALKRRLAQDRERIALPDAAIRARLAEAHGWLAEQELFSPVGSKRAAIKAFLCSLRYRPWQKRRLVLLALSLLVPRAAIERLRAANRRFVAGRS